jgi:hypothetical protein
MKYLFPFQQVFFACLLVATMTNIAQSQVEEHINKNRFRQLGTELPTPNTYRTASGAPGHEYWQQKADYDIAIELDDEKQRIYGTQTITYTNNSPDDLDYLWLQLDQNMRAKDSDTYKIRTNNISSPMNEWGMRNLAPFEDFDGGFKIDYVKDKAGKTLPYVVNKTMMRVDLPQPLKSKSSVAFTIKWWYNINNRIKHGGRSGYEYFAQDDNYIYTIAQFYPRMAVYSDNEGWIHKQFLGRGEFTLSFGDYSVKLTVPSDHIVAATGVLQNPNEVLTTEQRKRLEQAKNSFEKPVIIVTQAEAEKAEKNKSKQKKTWHFKAQNVRDFAFASSRKHIWDAMGVKMSNRTVLAMSFYPKEANPLWEKYSTKVVAHTLKTYSKYTFDYPYPVAISVHGDRIGMEYPMICFNYGKPEPDGTYSAATKYGMISVIIHEVGHNYFPMIVNSDERNWTWMDEGLNTFLQYLTEQEWEKDYPSRRGPAYLITDYMKTDKNQQTPIMTNSESIANAEFGNNGYGKPATALNILRETILGRELFDFAFKQYSQRWMFKHPTPADFFRTMEDASGTDLDWFWRGWFFTTDHVDIAIDGVKYFRIDSKNPSIEKPLAAKERQQTKDAFIGNQRNKIAIKTTWADKDPDVKDFYNEYNEFAVDAIDEAEFKQYLDNLGDELKYYYDKNRKYYEISFSNKGGLVMPIILKFTFEDGSEEVQYIPAEIWQVNNYKISKVFFFDKAVKSVELDPYLETADTDRSNNYYPAIIETSKFELFKQRSGGGENPMQRQKRAEKMK